MPTGKTKHHQAQLSQLVCFPGYSVTSSILVISLVLTLQSKNVLSPDLFRHLDDRRDLELPVYKISPIVEMTIILEMTKIL